MTEPSNRRRVAIACQGGGSHTAFTAGVLGRCFAADALERFEVVGLSGTSGGAICALVAWSALIQDEPGRAAELLAQFWAANAASWPVERVANSMMLWGARMAEQFGSPNLSPYDSFLSAWSFEHVRTMVNSVVDFDALAPLATSPEAPLLLLGAVEVVSGQHKTFNSRAGEISADAVLASAAIPSMFRSVNLHGGAYWDGLSQNPPIRDLMETIPDELWVCQVNPTSIDYEPTTVAEITNRRNELAGNLSLLQELGALEMFDELIARGELTSTRLRPVTIRLLEMPRPPSAVRWSHMSKLDRDPRFISELIELGTEQAHDFLQAIRFEDCWQARDGDSMLDYVAEGATLSVDLPGVRIETTDDPDTVERFFSEQLAAVATVDLTRKRSYRDGGVHWDLRLLGGDPIGRGAAAGRFREGLLTELTISATALL